MKNYYLVALLTSGLSLTGCATPENYKTRLETSLLCCDQLSEVPYQPLAYNKPMKATLGSKKSPARHFPEGKSFFLAAKLPAYQGTSELTISSESVGQQLFAPQVWLLNEQFQTLETIPAETFQYSNGQYDYTAFLNEDKDYRYLMIYTRADQVGKTNKQRVATFNASPVFVAGGIINIQQGGEANSNIINSEGGKVSIILKKYQPKSINP